MSSRWGALVWPTAGLAAGCVLFSQSASADYLADDELRRSIAGKTLKAKTAKDGNLWQVRIGANGQAEFAFADRSRRLARWTVKGKRIEFTFEQPRESTCRSILITEGRQEWQDCDSGKTSSFILQPTFTASESATAVTISPDVQRRLDIETEALKSRGYEVIQPASMGTVAGSSSMKQQLDLSSKSTYAVIAACDENCSHVVLCLRDPGGGIVAQSPEVYHTVIVSGPIEKSGAYVAELTAPGCQKDKCAVGFQLVRLVAPK